MKSKLFVLLSFLMVASRLFAGGNVLSGLAVPYGVGDVLDKSLAAEINRNRASERTLIFDPADSFGDEEKKMREEALEYYRESQGYITQDEYNDEMDGNVKINIKFAGVDIENGKSASLPNGTIVTFMHQGKKEQQQKESGDGNTEDNNNLEGVNKKEANGGVVENKVIWVSDPHGWRVLKESMNPDLASSESLEIIFSEGFGFKGLEDDMAEHLKLWLQGGYLSALEIFLDTSEAIEKILPVIKENWKRSFRLKIKINDLSGWAALIDDNVVPAFDLVIKYFEFTGVEESMASYIGHWLEENRLVGLSISLNSSKAIEEILSTILVKQKKSDRLQQLSIRVDKNTVSVPNKIIWKIVQEIVGLPELMEAPQLKELTVILNQKYNLHDDGVELFGKYDIADKDSLSPLKRVMLERAIKFFLDQLKRGCKSGGDGFISSIGQVLGGIFSTNKPDDEFDLKYIKKIIEESRESFLKKIDDSKSKPQEKALVAYDMFVIYYLAESYLKEFLGDQDSLTLAVTKLDRQKYPFLIYSYGLYLYLQYEGSNNKLLEHLACEKKLLEALIQSFPNFAENQPEKELLLNAMAKKLHVFIVRLFFCEDYWLFKDAEKVFREERYSAALRVIFSLFAADLIKNVTTKMEKAKNEKEEYFEFLAKNKSDIQRSIKDNEQDLEYYSNHQDKVARTNEQLAILQPLLDLYKRICDVVGKMLTPQKKLANLTSEINHISVKKDLDDFLKYLQKVLKDEQEKNSKVLVEILNDLEKLKNEVVQKSRKYLKGAKKLTEEEGRQKEFFAEKEEELEKLEERKAALEGFFQKDEELEKALQELIEKFECIKTLVIGGLEDRKVIEENSDDW